MTSVGLPDHTHLPHRILQFLDHHLATPNHLHLRRDYTSSSLSCTTTTNTTITTRATDLATELSRECDELDAHLQSLHQNLSKLLLSWISRSIQSKSSLQKLKLNLASLSKAPSISPCGIVKIQKMLGEDLARLALELKRIENIRSYADSTLQLERMVGDLEDAAFSVVNQPTGYVLAAISSNPSVSTDQGSRQEKFFQAIKSMNDIEELLLSPAKFQPHWSHLMKSVDSRVDKILTLLRPQVLADHRALLSSLGWPSTVLTSKIENGKISVIPNPLVLIQVDKHKAYSESFLALCALQNLQTRREERQLSLLGQKKTLIVGLWAIDELVLPIASRIEYHFSKWTDQPDFIFALVYKITGDFIVGVDDVLQPLMDKAKLVSLSAKEAWVSAMVQTLSVFLAKRVFSVLAERYKEKKARLEVISSWLHLIDLMVKFDKNIRTLVSSETYLFLGDSERLEGSSGGLSVFSLFSERPDWLKIWAKIELKDIRMKLKAELKHERAWLVDIKQEVGSAVDRTTDQFLFLYTWEDHKVPLIVESALKLAWEMIERCKTLPGILARIQFIRSTAMKVLWYLFDLLLWRFKRTEFLTSDCNDSLLTQCELINAARYCESKLKEWSNDINFLEMRIAENDKYMHVKDDVEDNCYFFAEEIKCLADMEIKYLMEIIAGLLHQFETLSQEYVQNKERFEQEEDVSICRTSDSKDFSVSVDFLEALDILRGQLCIINGCLNPKDFSDLWRIVADGLDRFIFGSIFMSDYRFSGRGTNQFGADVRALFLVFQPFCARPEAFFPYIRNSLKLLEMDRQDLERLQVVASNAVDKTECLRACGILHLSFDQAKKILRNRKFRISATGVIS